MIPALLRLILAEHDRAAPAAAPAAAAAKDVNVPDIGSDEVEVTEILVKVGDKVEAEQSLITIEALSPSTVISGLMYAF